MPKSTSSAPRPAPSAPKPTTQATKPVTHQGQQSTKGTAVQSGWGGKK